MVYSIIYFIAPYICGFFAGFMIARMIIGNKKVIIFTSKKRKYLDGDDLQLNLFD